MLTDYLRSTNTEDWRQKLKMLWRLRVMVKLLLLFLVSSSSANLEIYHGQVGAEVEVNRVFGVTLVNTLDTSTSHFLDCTSPSTSPGDLRWEREGGDQRFPTGPFNGRNLRLDFAPKTGQDLRLVMSSDLGVYTCVDTITADRLSVTIMEGSEAIVAVESSMVSLVGDSTQLSVYAIADPPLTSSQVEWRDPRGNVISSGGRFSLHDGNKGLVIESVQLADSGIYMVNIVRLISGVNTVEASTSIDLNVQVDPVVVLSPVLATRREHESVMLSCVFSGNPQPMVTWEREGRDTQLPVATRRTITSTSVQNQTITLFTVTNELVISPVLYEDRGRYRCKATNTHGEAVSDGAQLTVIPRLQLTARAPTTIDGGGKVIISEGSRVEIHCSGSSDMLWISSTGQDITVETDISTAENIYQRNDPTNNEQILFIENFSPSLAAIYTCNTDLVVDGDSIAVSVFITNADPAVEFADHTVYAQEHSTAQIAATVHSTDRDALILKWFHEGLLIDTSSNARYFTTEEGDSTYVLNVVGVARGDLGRYDVLASVGDRNDSDTVQLMFPDPPDASVVPRRYTVFENDSTSFQCQAGGTLSIVVWTLLGSEDLPTGTYQDGNDLVVTQANRNHSGRYLCTVTNIVGMSDTSIATLTVNYIPTALIVHETQATSEHVQVTAEHGDMAPVISCLSDGSPAPSLTWVGQSGIVSLPRGMSTSLSDGRTQSTLTWDRPLSFTDSGRYFCNSTNQFGRSVATLELLVRKLPVITSIFPNSSIVALSSSKYAVPLGYDGTLLTCAAFGWPAPSIKWLRDGEELTGRIVSYSRRRDTSAYVSAILSWQDGFLESDAGNYTCIVQTNDTYYESEVISLQGSRSLSQTPTSSRCVVKSKEVSFQLRVSGVDCSAWEDGLKQLISSSFQSILVSIVDAICQDCSITLSDIAMADNLKCIEQENRALLLTGKVATEDKSRTKLIFCALRMWQQNQPLLQVYGQYYSIDGDCDIAADSPAGMECSATGSSISLAPTLPTMSGFSLTVISLLLSFFIVS